MRQQGEALADHETASKYDVAAVASPQRIHRRENMARWLLFLFVATAFVCIAVHCSLATTKHQPRHRALESHHGDPPLDAFQTESSKFADRNLLEFPTEQVDMIMPIGGQDSMLDANLPELITGLWWFAELPGAELTSVAGSFAGAEWNAKKRTIALETTVPRVWAWRGDEEGREDVEFFSSLSLNQAYFFTFDETMTTIRIQPQITFLYKFTIRVPAFLFDFSATRVDDDTWLLERMVLWNDWGSYFMRRIVDKNGVRLPIYPEFLKNTTETLIAIDYDD